MCCQNCATPVKGLGTQSHLSHSPTQWRNKHYRHLLMREVEGEQRNSTFGTRTTAATDPELKLCGSMWGVNGYHLTSSNLVHFTHGKTVKHPLHKGNSPSVHGQSILIFPHILPHRSFTRDILHLSTYKSFLTSINTLLSVITVCGTMERFYLILDI